MSQARFTLPATLADRWVVERQLGQGGMSVVYLARDRRHDREVAIKVLRPELAAAIGADRFLREIRIAAKLSHPHIVPLFDSLEVDGRLLYVMPYVAGESLRDRLDRDGPLPIADAMEITRQVASALDYAHAAGVVHRDIKPENILLQAGQAVVTDFGIARAIDRAAAEAGADRLTETGVVVGTPRYMSPEQIAGDDVSARSDVYSLGCVLFEMVTGSPPFDGPNSRIVLGRHAVEAPPSPRSSRPEIDRDLEASILSALAKHPEDRFATAGDLSRAISGQAPRPRLRRARSRRLLAALASVLGVMAAWGGYRMLAGSGSDRVAARLAVLYLDNRTRDSADQYLADGITEEMIWRFGQVERLQISSRGAVRRFRERPIDDPAELGLALGARYLVTGSLERDGARLRVRVALVDAASGSHLWGATFDPRAGDLFALQDSIAHAVATEVVGRLAPAERVALAARPTDNLEAYDHYLRGNFYLSRRTGPADGRRALDEYEAALAIEPRFPAALARLGLVYGIYASWPWDYPGLGTDSLVARGLAAADRAIALDSTNADGWLARGFLLMPGPADTDASQGFAVSPNIMTSGVRCWSGVPDCLAAARAALERAVARAPRNAEAWYQLGRARLFLAEGDSAVARSLALEPDRAVSAWLLGWTRLARGAPAEALPMLDSAIALGRRDVSTHGIRLEARLATGDLSGARADLDRLGQLVRGDSLAEAFHATMTIAVLARSGDSAGAREALRAMLRRFPEQPTSRRSIRLATAAALVSAGEHERGLGVLDAVATAVSGIFTLRSTLWDPVRSTSRFAEIIRRTRDRSPWA